VSVPRIAAANYIRTIGRKIASSELRVIWMLSVRRAPYRPEPGQPICQSGTSSISKFI